MSTGESPPVPAYLISLPDGRVRHELGGHKRFVHAVAFRPDGKCLATLGDEGTIRVWDTGSGRELRAIEPGHPARRTRASWGAAAGARTAGGSPAPRRTARSGSGIPRPGGRRPGSPRTPDPWPGARTGPGSPRAWSRDLGLEVRPWDARDGAAARACPQATGLRSARSAWSPDGRRLAAIWTDTDGGLARVVADRLGRDERGEGLPGRRTSRRCGRSPSAPTAPGWRRAAKEGIVRVFDAADGRERAALFTGCHERQRPGVQPRWPPALRRRLGDGRGQGLRPGPRSPRPAAFRAGPIRSRP